MRLLVSISHHGLGHLAQTAPVLSAIHTLNPAVRFVIRTALDPEVVRQRLPHPFEYHASAMDCGFIMQDALRLDLDASMVAYQAQHACWASTVEAESDWLQAHRIDGVLSNVAYLPLAAAGHAGLPCAGLCSLNWLDIFRHYLGGMAGAERIQTQIRAAYLAADMFIRPEPAMMMAEFPHAVQVAPIAQGGCNQARVLRRRLGVEADTRVVLIGMGGIGYRLEPDALPAREGLLWLVPDVWGWEAAHVLPFSRTGSNFSDLLASADALVTKPGYGSFVEAVGQGVPVLYLPREDWPETPALVAWLHAHGRAACMTEYDLKAGGLPEALAELWRQEQPASIEMEGAGQAARHLLTLFA